MRQYELTQIVAGGSEKRDYRNRWRVDRIVHMDLFDWRGKKREDQLQGGLFLWREGLDCRSLRDRFIARLGAFPHSLPIKHRLFCACKGRSSISH